MTHVKHTQSNKTKTKRKRLNVLNAYDVLVRLYVLALVSAGKIAKTTTKNVSNALSVAINPAFRSLRGSFFVKGLPMSVAPAAKLV